MNLSKEPARGTVANMTLGAVSFAVVSVLGFAVWAIGGKWLHAHVGEGGLFAACAIVFLGSSGLLMHPLVRGTNRLARFYMVFIPAFLAYAIVWSGSWFVLHFGLGEWLASLLGSIAFVTVARWILGSGGNLLRACSVMFIAHSAGYFLGGKSMAMIGGHGVTIGSLNKEQIGILAKLAWGLLYGFGFGAGIGYTFSAFDNERFSDKHK